MKIAIVVSEKDIAGMNIKEQLIKNYPFKITNLKYDGFPVYEYHFENKIKSRLYTTKKEAVYCEGIDKEIDAELFIFATKHRSESRIPSLSVHSPGNWGKAELGGKDRMLCVCPANYLKEAMSKLNQLNVIKFDVVQECTHHGPYLEKPVMFIEIGSSENEWRNKEAAEIIAKVIFYLVTTEIPIYETAVGIGGLHTTPNFKKIILNTNIAIGHVCPKYNLQYLDEEMLLQAIEKSISKASIIILDWKGLGTEKARIKKMLEDLNVEFTRTDRF